MELATLDISLLIAGIPIALPTVMSLIISVGVVKSKQKKHAIVRRLSALEELANVNMLPPTRLEHLLKTVSKLTACFFSLQKMRKRLLILQ